MKRCEHCTIRLGTVVMTRWTSGVTSPCAEQDGHSFIEVPGLPKRPIKPLVKRASGMFRTVPGNRYRLDGDLLVAN